MARAIDNTLRHVYHWPLLTCVHAPYQYTLQHESGFFVLHYWWVMSEHKAPTHFPRKDSHRRPAAVHVFSHIGQPVDRFRVSLSELCTRTPASMHTHTRSVKDRQGERTSEKEKQRFAIVAFPRGPTQLSKVILTLYRADGSQSLHAETRCNSHRGVMVSSIAQINHRHCFHQLD